MTGLAELPAPETSVDAINAPEFTLGAFDELTITVFGVPELSGDVIVDPQGRVAVPLAGSIEAAGKTPAELTEAIAARLIQFIREPEVTVNVKEAASRTITVDGQVKDPGIFRATNNLTLMRAVATAKGTTPDANLDQVVVFRTVAGQQMAALYSLKAIRRGTYTDPALYPEDIVIVGDSPRTRLIREIAPVLATPVVLLLQTVIP